MELIVIGSSSKGNSYVLKCSSGQLLLIEAGVKLQEIKKAISFRIRDIAGCIVTHEHQDHAKSMVEIMKAGVDVYSSAGTQRALNITNQHRSKTIASGTDIHIGEFRVKAFDVKHDAMEPLGFLIQHHECGTIVFITDTYYVPYKFTNLNNIIIEANYSEEILAESSNVFLRDRIVKSHMSLETCVDMLRANDLTKVNNIVLIHLSDRNSDAVMFQSKIQQCTGKSVTIADVGTIIKLNQTPF